MSLKIDVTNQRIAIAIRLEFVLSLVLLSRLCLTSRLIGRECRGTAPRHKAHDAVFERCGKGIPLAFFISYL